MSSRVSFALGVFATTLVFAAAALLLRPTPLQAAEDTASTTGAIPAIYANFCRVTGTPEEVVLDFGLNTQVGAAPAGPIEVSQRIVLNPYTAKRMATALVQTIQRHEAAFGTIETDVQKRVKQPAK